MTSVSPKSERHLQAKVPTPPSKPPTTSNKGAGMSLAQKLGLVSLLLIAPAAIQTFNVIRIQQNELTSLRNAQSVEASIEASHQLQAALENYVNAAAQAKQQGQGLPAAEGEVKAAIQKLQESIADVAVTDAEQPEIELESLEKDWQLYSQAYPHQSTLDIADGAEALFLDYIEPVNDFLQEQGSFSTATEAQSAAPLANIVAQQNPELREFILTSSVQNAVQDVSSLGEYERQNYREELRVARQNLLELQQAANQIPEGLSTEEFQVYRQNLGDFTTAIEAYLQNLEQAVDGNTVTNLEPLATTALSQAQKLSETAINALNNDVQQSLREASNTQLLNQLLTVLLIAAGIILLYFIISAILRAINNLSAAAQSLSKGDFATRVPITSNDELGTVSNAFNAAATQLEENQERAAQERLEQEQLQNNIGSFLDVTMDIAEGDLTKRGVVTEDVLGNVVDSINLMTEELSYVLGDVQSASKSVGAGSQQMLSTTNQIQEGTAMTAAEARRVAQQVEELTANIRQMADQAQQSADAARQALLASQQGQEAVTGTLDGMQNIRREVQGVAKSIKGLGDRSLEIQEIVDTISGIARQTNLLALNATIEAAGAGEAGGRFSIVADEVRKLADNSANATGRIAQLIQNIQSEIQDVVVNVEESTREVEQGYRVAGMAGERLRQIGDLTQQSAQLAENISSATQQQVDGIEQMGNAVQQIAQIARRSEASVEQGRAAADQLQQLADELNASLARFRLPS